MKILGITLIDLIIEGLIFFKPNKDNKISDMDLLAERSKGIKAIIDPFQLGEQWK